MKKSKFKTLAIGGVILTLLFSMAGCGGQGDSSSEGEKDGAKNITVISREDGSGTRDAFTELTGVMEDDVDRTVSTAEISNSTSVVMQSVAGNEEAIGYISLGSMNEEIKAVKVDGVEATAENVKKGDYKISRPFNIVTKGKVDKLSQDFIDYIMSQDGQEIIEREGYIASVDEAEAYEASGLKGRITIAGSTSVAPVMEVLAETYRGLNEGVNIEIQQNGSSAGIQSTLEGVCDIGMASRELEDEEAEAGLKSEAIALDGIAVILNNNNLVDDMSMDTIMKIFIGEITDWAEVQ